MKKHFILKTIGFTLLIVTLVSGCISTSQDPDVIEAQKQLSIAIDMVNQLESDIRDLPEISFSPNMKYDLLLSAGLTGSYEGEGEMFISLQDSSINNRNDQGLHDVWGPGHDIWEIEGYLENLIHEDFKVEENKITLIDSKLRDIKERKFPNPTFNITDETEDIYNEYKILQEDYYNIIKDLSIASTNFHGKLLDVKDEIKLIEDSFDYKYFIQHDSDLLSASKELMNIISYSDGEVKSTTESLRLCIINPSCSFTEDYILKEERSLLSMARSMHAVASSLDE